MSTTRTTAIALAVACAVAAPAAAQNREHLQMAAELRILQEQQQQLAASLTQLADAIKAQADAPKPAALKATGPAKTPPLPTPRPSTKQ